MNDNKTYEMWLERFSAGEAKLEQVTGHANVQYAGGTLPLAYYDAEEQMAILAASEDALKE